LIPFWLKDFGNRSGGQRRRVSIGLELASAPLALFLDEPTTGLDATSAMEVCRVLREVAEEIGLTVVMVRFFF
jgi:ABC-type multidrug transport system ATPase subunit